jgi:hypothetical protein
MPGFAGGGGGGTAGLGRVEMVGVDGEGGSESGGVSGSERVGGERRARISTCRRDMKPGSIDVPPMTSIEEISSFRKSTGTYAASR